MRNGRTLATGLDVRVGPVSESTTEQQSGVLFFSSVTCRLVLQARVKLHKHKHLKQVTHFSFNNCFLSSVLEPK